MTRDQFLEITKRLPGVSSSKKGPLEVAEGHELSIYVGPIGAPTLAIAEVQSVVVEASHIEVRSGDRRQVFVPFENVQWISVKPPRTDEPRRTTGFA